MAALDLEQFWENADESTCTIVIRGPVGETQLPPSKRSRTRADHADSVSCSSNTFHRLPGHGVVLKAASPVFKAQLERWVGKGQDGRPELVLEVGDQAEADALHNVLRYAYTGKLPGRGTSTLILGMLITADRYDVNACINACAAALETGTQTDDELRAMLGVLACTPHAIVKATIIHSLQWIWVARALRRDKPALRAAAQAHVQAHFGDLDVALANKTLRARLTWLPISSLLELLRHDATAAGSEMSVVAAMALWAERNHPDVATAQALALTLRVRSLRGSIPESMALASLLPLAPFLQFGAAQLLPIVMSMPDVHATPDTLRGMGLADPCSWLLPCRPPSSRTQLESSWSVTAEQLATVRSASATLTCSERHLFQGLWVQLSVRQSDRGEPAIYIGAKPPFRVDSTCKWAVRLVGQLWWSDMEEQIDHVLGPGVLSRGWEVQPPGSVNADVTIKINVSQCG